MKISVTVTLKKDVLDPQGKVVSQTLKNMGYKNVINVRQGKFFEIELNETNKENKTPETEKVRSPPTRRVRFNSEVSEDSED